jgi:hypothetical protein
LQRYVANNEPVRAQMTGAERRPAIETQHISTTTYFVASLITDRIVLVVAVPEAIAPPREVSENEYFSSAKTVRLHSPSFLTSMTIPEASNRPP